MLLISLLTVQLQTKVPNMAYGSIKSISDSILESTDGESIQEQIDAYMQSTTSGTTGDGVIANAAIRKDAGAIVKSLGARAKVVAEPAVVIDRAASVTRDWTALMMANDQDNSAINAAFLSDEIAANASSAPETTDEAFLQTGVLPAGGDTGNGLMSSLRPEARSFTTASSTTESNGLMRSLRPEARPDNIIEDIQLQQDIDIDLDPMVIAKPVLKGTPIPFSEGSVEGLVNTYTVNGVDRSIIDVGQTTVSEGYYPQSPLKIDPQNVVMHYTATEYSGGVRHYMNSFVGRNNVTAAFLVDRSGKIYQTFDPTVKGAHVHGSRTRNPNQIITNSNSIGVEVVATEQNPPSAKQLEASSWLTDYLTAQYGTSRVVAHPQANVHKGNIEGFDIVNHWRKGKGLPELTVSEEAIKNLLTLTPSRSLRPQKRPN